MSSLTAVSSNDNGLYSLMITACWYKYNDVLTAVVSDVSKSSLVVVFQNCTSHLMHASEYDNDLATLYSYEHLYGATPGLGQ